MGRPEVAETALDVFACLCVRVGEVRDGVPTFGLPILPLSGDGDGGGDATFPGIRADVWVRAFASEGAYT